MVMASLMIMGTLPIAFPRQLSFSRTEVLGLSISSTAPVSVSFSSPISVPSVYCGRGDRKTAKGKRFNHSFGNARPRNKNKGRGPPRVPVAPSTSPPKKDKYEDNEKIKIDIDESLFDG
ncbi:30S ribosomal protein S31, chloroplastic-like [Papaver somniferum]|uniref:30S ribosomal protein S31, chloroplastic-like n=1 Tax=Papaver somniferum TaxID=3469 RepID=UPI000E70242E|nr:30S ribosomal protein S31, chloroplastic-like [Papaver somniferum]